MSKNRRNRGRKSASKSSCAEQNLPEVRNIPKGKLPMVALGTAFMICLLAIIMKTTDSTDNEAPSATPTPAHQTPISVNEEWDKLRRYDSEVSSWREVTLEMARASQNDCIIHLRNMLRNRVLLTPTELIEEGGSVTIDDERITIAPGNKRLLVMVPPDSFFARVYSLGESTPAVYNQNMRTVFMLRLPLSNWSKAALLMHEGIHALEDINGSMTHTRRPSTLTMVRSEMEAYANSYQAMVEYTQGRFAEACERASLAYEQNRAFTTEELRILKSSFGGDWFHAPNGDLGEGLIFPLVGFHRILKKRLPLHEQLLLVGNHLENIGYEMNSPGTNSTNSARALTLLIELDAELEAIDEERSHGLSEEQHLERHRSLAPKMRQIVKLDRNYAGGWIALCRYYEREFLEWIKANPGKPGRGSGQPFESGLLESTLNALDLRGDAPLSYEFRVFALANFGSREEARSVVNAAKERFKAILTEEQLVKLESYLATATR